MDDYAGPCMCGGCQRCLRDQGYSQCPTCGHYGCDCEPEPEGREIPEPDWDEIRGEEE
jgi:hypothetical protein